MSFGISAKQGNKDNSRRKYPGAGGRRHNPVGVKVRRESALERQKYWSGLSLVQQLKALDQRLGAGKGATKQRARLQRLIEGSKRSTGTTPTVGLAPGELNVVAAETGTKIKAKDRRAQERQERRNK